MKTEELFDCVEAIRSDLGPNDDWEPMLFLIKTGTPDVIVNIGGMVDDPDKLWLGIIPELILTNKAEEVHVVTTA